MVLCEDTQVKVNSQMLYRIPSHTGALVFRITSKNLAVLSVGHRRDNLLGGDHGMVPPTHFLFPETSLCIAVKGSNSDWNPDSNDQ